MHARLNATDVRVQHSVAGKSDAEVAAEIEALRAKLEDSRSLSPPTTIEATAESIKVLPADSVAATTEVDRPSLPQLPSGH